VFFIVPQQDDGLVSGSISCRQFDDPNLLCTYSFARSGNVAYVHTVSVGTTRKGALGAEKEEDPPRAVEATRERGSMAPLQRQRSCALCGLPIAIVS
jgi:hypothetical protein